MSGVELIVSDGNLGIKKSVKTCFTEAKWQYCIVHWKRNVLKYTPHNLKGRVIYYLKMITDADCKESSLEWAEKTRKLLDQHHLKNALASFENGLQDALTYLSFPKEHWLKIRTTNMVESLNSRVKSRTRRIVVFPNEESCIRIIMLIALDFTTVWSQKNT